MKTWRLVSGIVSLAICILVLFQSCAAGLVNTIENNGQVSGTAGFIVAAMLIAGGVVSIVARGGGKGGNIAIIVLYGIGAFIGFTLAGNYSDLIIWAAWCLACAITAGVAFINSYGEDDPDEDEEEPAAPVKGSKDDAHTKKKPIGAGIKILIAVAAAFLLLIVIGALSSDSDVPPDQAANSNVVEYEPNLFYSDSVVDVTFTGIDNDGVHFSVENKTGKEISFVFRTLVLDGKSYSDGSGLIYDSTFIGPTGVGSVTTKLDGAYDTDISKISGTFLYGYSDFSTDGEEVTFQDISVSPVQ